VVVYGIDLLLCAVAWYVMQTTILRAEGSESAVREMLGRDLKGKLSPVLYLAGIGLSWVTPWFGLAFYTAVAVLWLLPDRRVERAMAVPSDT
jgi:uncharacterized membrane protein